MNQKANISVLGKLFLILVSVVFLAELQAQDYNVIERFKLSEDRVRTYEMLNPLRHDFIFDMTGMVNQDVLDVIDDAESINNSGSESEQLEKAREFLAKYDKTEQNVRVSLNIGVPLPSFNIGKTRLKPSIRAGANFGAVIGIRTGSISVSDVLSYLNISEDIKTALNGCDFDGIAALASASSDKQYDVVLYARDTNCITSAQANQIGLGEYYYKDASTDVPNLYTYLKAEARVGISVDYVRGKHWFGNFSLYGLGRADAQSIITENSLTSETELTSFGDEPNTTINAVTDFRFGYRNGRLRGWAAIEELKISEVSNNNELGGQLLYGSDPLLRLHGEYIYRFSGFSLKPFVGVHKRSGYGLSDGLYGGADAGFHFWGNRLGVRARGMLDKEHITMSPQLKLWLMHFDYMLKVPFASDVDGVKPATIHSLNVRFFI